MEVSTNTQTRKLLSDGFYSELLEHGDGTLEKIYGSKTEGFAADEATAIVANMRLYYQIADGLGIPTASPLHISIMPGESGFQIRERVPNAGKSLKAAMPEMGHAQAVNVIGQYLGMHAKAWKGGMPISLDPAYSNYCLGDDGQLEYIDAMPPRVRAQGITELPAPPAQDAAFLMERFYGKGIHRVIYAQTLRVLEPQHQISIEQVRFMMQDIIGEDAARAIRIPADEFQRIMKNPVPHDFDAIRIIAAEMRLRGQLSPEDTKKIYSLCHMDPGGILASQDEINQAVSLLAGKIAPV